jgi:hypothetical protein
MPTMNTKNFGLSGNASTDLGLGLGDQLNAQAEAEIAKRKKRAAQAMTNPMSGSAGMALLGTGAPGTM